MLSLHHYEQVKSGELKEPAWMMPFHVDWPEGKRGAWSIKRFKVELDMSNLRLMRDGRGCFPGQYTMLRHTDRGVVMSDTTAEIGDHYCAFRKAHGRVLIHGLGLGSFLRAVLSKPEVTHVDVVEIDPDVIALVGKHFKDPRVTIHQGDALIYEWPKGTKWDLVWHDIWDQICGDNKAQMHKLHRRFGRRCRWQDSWSREYMEAVSM